MDEIDEDAIKHIIPVTANAIVLYDDDAVPLFRTMLVASVIVVVSLVVRRLRLVILLLLIVRLVKYISFI